MHIKRITQRVIVLTFTVIYLLSHVPVLVYAGCAPLSGVGNVCNAPFAQCVYQGVAQCCGDGVSQFVGNSECAALTGGATTGTGGDGQSFSATTGTLNGTIFGQNLNLNFLTPRGIISALLPYLFTLGGLILFVMLIWGGFEMLSGAANPKSQEAGKQRMTAAVIGFILLFASYWFAQLLQIIFGISVL